MSEEIKKILEKYNYHPTDEEVLELSKNIKQLARIIVDFEKRKKYEKDASPPKK